MFPFGQGISGSNNPVTFYNMVQFGSGVGPSIGSFSGGTACSGAVITFPGSGSILFTIGGQATSSGVGIVGASGGGSGSIMVGASGYPLTGSGGTVFAAGSGIFCPQGYFLIQVPTSGTPVVKVPFFAS